MHDRILKTHNADRSPRGRGRGMAVDNAIPPRRQGSIIHSGGAKGGVGKTMMATNQAVALEQERWAGVAPVDLDLPSGDVARRNIVSVVQAIDVSRRRASTLVERPTIACGTPGA